MARIQDYARKFTDAEYLTKKQISEIVGVSIAETVWRQTQEYREKYRFALDIKRFDKLPFSMVIPPSVMALANTAERSMLNYAMHFENYKLRESISDNKALTAFKESILKDDLQIIAHSLEMLVNEKDIEMMLEEDKFHLHNTVLWGYNKTVKYLVEESSLGFSKSLIRDMYNCINNSENTTLFYRSEGQLADQRRPINEFEGATGTAAKINEHVNMLLEFYSADYELSPFIIASIMFTYFLYISPFEKHNLYIATLLMLKIVADAGYGECVYYTSMIQFILQRKDELKEVFDEVKRNGDLTYAITFLCKQFIESLNWKDRNLQKIELPKPYLDPVRIVKEIQEVEVFKEKEVEKIVEKIVEVPVEKEVIVEKVVYRDRIVEKEVEVPKVEEVKPTSYDEYDDYDDYEEENKQIDEFKEEPTRSYSEYEYNDNDPFARIPISKLNLEEPVVKKPVTVEPIVSKEEEEAKNENERLLAEKARLEAEIARLHEQARLNEEANIKKLADEEEEEVIEETNEEPTLVNEEVTPAVEEVVVYEEPTVEVAPVVKTPIIAKQHQVVEKITSLDALKGLENDAFAKALVEMNPTIKYNQALFYVRHRTVGRYYTIGQFKDFLDCAYETARTSMEFMTALGLYRKEQLKNKFVYTPVDFDYIEE